MTLHRNIKIELRILPRGSYSLVFANATRLSEQRRHATINFEAYQQSPGPVLLLSILQLSQFGSVTVALSV